jgi:hypothetical protein
VAKTPVSTGSNLLTAAPRSRTFVMTLHVRNKRIAEPQFDKFSLIPINSPIGRGLSSVNLTGRYARRRSLQITRSDCGSFRQNAVARRIGSCAPCESKWP